MKRNYLYKKGFSPEEQRLLGAELFKFMRKQGYEQEEIVILLPAAAKQICDVIAKELKKKGIAVEQISEEELNND